MQFGFVIPGGDAGEMVDMAVQIEEAGWDAALGWETVYGLDAWVLLGAIAARTSRIRLGTLLSPPSRRRPWKLASEVATLDRLSGGRAVLAVGLGAPETGFAQVGEVVDRRIRAELLDESLLILEGFWKGGAFSHRREHYQVDWQGGRWDIAPIQRPRPPIWVVGVWPSERSMRRAYAWDGVIPTRKEGDSYPSVSPDDVVAIREAAQRRHLAGGQGFDIVIEGVTPPDDAVAIERARAFAEAGATWWIESMWDHPGGLEAIRERIAAGPPRL
jgi:alkanesulfonate monooxygenase SsuD/methylene tetrahydromethanopterin reductase-like flavin-dependent oxidoreductase (luciferase family)